MSLDGTLWRLQLIAWSLTATALGVWLIQIGLQALQTPALNY